MNQEQKTALFTNFSIEEFTGHWDGRPHKFASGQSKYLPDYLAKHFARTLTNRELLRKDAGGNLIYKDGEKMTSPKFPEQVPLFMELFNKAYTPDESEKEEQNALDVEIDVLNKNNEKKEVKTDLENKPPQVISSPDDDDEESFGNKPK